MQVKKYQQDNVLIASEKRISKIFDEFEKIYCSFSGGKDSTVMLHLIMQEAIKRNRKIGVLFIDLEAQYSDTIKHVENIFEMYKDNIEPYWCCLQLKLRNALTNFEPQWCCWDKNKKDMWVREMPNNCIKDEDLPFFVPKMEF